MDVIFTSSDLQVNKGGVSEFNANVSILFLPRVDKNESSDARPLPANYKKPCPQFDRSHAEEMAHWAKDHTLALFWNLWRSCCGRPHGGD